MHTCKETVPKRLNDDPAFADLVKEFRRVLAGPKSDTRPFTLTGTHQLLRGRNEDAIV